MLRSREERLKVDVRGGKAIERHRHSSRCHLSDALAGALFFSNGEALVAGILNTALSSEHFLLGVASLYVFVFVYVG